MSVALVVPTVTGREDLYRATLDSLTAEHYPYALTVFTEVDRPCLGDAYERAIRELSKDTAVAYVLLHGDDATAFPTWLAAAMSCVRDGFLPGATVFWPNGTLVGQEIADGTIHDGVRGPHFLPIALAKEILPFPPLQAYVDCWVCAACAAKGWKHRQSDLFGFVNSGAESVHDATRYAESESLWLRIQASGDPWSFA